MAIRKVLDLFSIDSANCKAEHEVMIDNLYLAAENEAAAMAAMCGVPVILEHSNAHDVGLELCEYIDSIVALSRYNRV